MLNKKFDTNAYVLELSKGIFINPIFNIKDLLSYKGVRKTPNMQDDSFAEA